MKEHLVPAKLPSFEDFRSARYVRSAQNHRSTILFVDGRGIVITRRTEIVEIPYDRLQLYQKSEDGVEWTQVVPP